ncbi:DUF58 domain-containing protein [Autumnicola edwardsiae]|uniref:DUF58 domain-containing protein n=1 Tax=Autumnicola edwardsiae TaxID=3075594 RepID=A0ABU3CVR8_9FLAO|nr:DUF58 domain-containing protein [Zunongwangia sp. F297]MDT0650401.1 DUF58 domain-containing protein [Zunongwangia sp. F297]
MIKFFKSLYFTQRVFVALFTIAVIFLFSYWFEVIYTVAWLFVVVLVLFVILDIVTLFKNTGLNATRILSEKFSNSDENAVKVEIRNKYNFQIRCEVIDELPVQFQKRDFLKIFTIPAKGKHTFEYLVRPVHRGEYIFGKLNLYATTKLRLAKKRQVFDEDQMVKVYPSFIQMKKLDFLAIDNKISQPGLKKIRRIGHTMEFEQIKEYVTGDDVRTINWKATAKQGNLMVNQFQDQKAQPVYSVIDTGRVMKMPFNGLSLLDYAINSALAFSNVALKKKDKVGFLSFSNELEYLLGASSKFTQLNRILETLYNVKTGFRDPDYSLLYSRVKKHINQRSLLMLYTNFEHPSGLKRQLPYLKALARKHVLVVIFFENTEVQKLIETDADSVASSAHQTIAEQFSYDKIKMAKELQRNGIQTILTKPEDLSINTINKYLEIKARGIL